MQHPACRQRVLEESYGCGPTFLGNSIVQFGSMNFVNANVMARTEAHLPGYP